jgi:sugar phosphate isomerase/epimerase
VTPVRVPAGRVGLSTVSVYPQSTAAAFSIASALGYDGVEVMVWADPVSQDGAALRALSDHYGLPILAVHAPCLFISRRVWTTDPWVKLERARQTAEVVGAGVVVVHPPFRWQREYARDFATGIDRMTAETSIRFAVENMYPVRMRGREVTPYLPSWDVTAAGYPHVTLDLSHTAAAHVDALQTLAALGDRVVHVHAADGTGSGRDEHLVPGRGSQPCAAVLEALAGVGFTGHVVVEVNTRHRVDRDEREADLAEALAFCRLNLAAPALP